MEEMSKKTKRLEKENSTLTRKSDMSSGKIFTMAEERERYEHEINTLKKRNDNLEKLCRGMQAQGRTEIGGDGSEKRAAPLTNGTNRTKARTQGQELPHVCRHPHHHHHHPARSSYSNLAATTHSAQGDNIIHDEAEGTESDYEGGDSADVEDEDEDEDERSRSRSPLDQDHDRNHNALEADEAIALDGYDPLAYNPARQTKVQGNAAWEHGGSNDRRGDSRNPGGDETEDESLALRERLPSPPIDLEDVDDEEEQESLRRRLQYRQLHQQQQDQVAQQKENRKRQATAGARDSSASNNNSRLSWLGSLGRRNSSTNSDNQIEAQQGSAGGSSIPPPKTVNRFPAKSPGGGVVHGVGS